MTRSALWSATLHGGGLLLIALCIGPTAHARQDRPRADAAPPAVAASAATTPKPGAPGGTGQEGQASAAQSVAGAGARVAAPVVAAPAASPRPADPTEGDRTALINQDVAQHPPQTAIASRDPSHLQTAKMKLGGLLDRSVHSLENSEVGRVIDVMTGDDGRPAALELDVGGFMGVGNRRIAVAWSLFDLSRTGQNDPLRVALSAAQVRSAPAMDEGGETPVVTGATPVTAEPATRPAEATPAAAGAVPALPPGPVLTTPPAVPPVLAPPPGSTVDTSPAPVVPAGSAPGLPAAAGPAMKPPAPHQGDGAEPSPRSEPNRQRADRDASGTPRSRNGEDQF